MSGYTADNRLYAETFKVAFGPGGNPAIAQLWGRNRLKAISAKLMGEPNQADVKAATDTALSYNLLSDYTAFVAVSEEQRVDKHGKSIRVEVPVEMPQGMTMGADKKELSRSVSGIAPAPSRVNVQAPHPKPMVDAEEKVGNLPAPVVAIVSAQGLEPKGRASLERQLQTLTVPAGQPAELTIALTVVRGKVTLVKVTKQTGAADAATVKAIVDGLKAWKAPVWVDGQVQLVIKVRG
ncbi:hypothetical protein D3C72_1415840 [compost metagenome]